MRISIDRDKNGNKIARFTPGGGLRGFSVQTLDNMPETHRGFKPGDMLEGNESIAAFELRIHVLKHGTDRQRAITARYY